MKLALAGAAVLVGAAAAVSFRTAGGGNLGPGPVDALVVFGSPAELHGELSPMQAWRVHEAVKESRRGEAMQLIFTGGAAANRFVEADVMAQEARRQGVPGEAILKESASTTTVENIRGVQRILQAHGWSRVEVISSPDHLPRIAILLRNAPFRWRLHPAPTPGRGRVSRILSYSQEAVAILLFRILGRAAEPVVHAMATVVYAIEFGVRWLWYRLNLA